jgi:hypothetical protein
VAASVNPDTMLAWHRKRMAQKFDGSQRRKTPGRPTIEQGLERAWCAWRGRIAPGAMTGLPVP